ncbi:MAG: restriction endonuclease subunit S [Candidatus Eremiobacteraeota bacterium]|nr:restriction endonuclease subunit S [Candidatus Eremiobacteraeota bacterium]
MDLFKVQLGKSATVNRWPLKPLEDVVEDVLDRRGVTPLKLGSTFKASGNRVISAKVIKGRTIDLSAGEPRFVDDTTYAKWMRTPLAAGDVILTSEAPLGEVAFLSQKVDWCLGQRLFAIRANRRVLDGRFLYYALQSSGVQNDILSRASGTTVHGIRQSELRRVLLPVPPLSEQRAIAGILGALDDKIELNRKMSETLEAMARALFKSWFVDFDPVRAKAVGRDPGLAPEIAALFPDSFEDSELGEIPKGWMTKNVEDVASISRKTVNPLEYPQETFEHYSIPAYDANRGATVEVGAAIRSSKFLVLQESILLSRLNPRTPRIGVPSPSGKHRAICSTEFAVMRPAMYSKEWLYCLVSSEQFCDTFASMVTGTSGSHQRVKPESLLAMPVISPPKSVVEAFTKIVDPLLKRIAFVRSESRTLAALRDALLPKLISGEIRVSDADRIVERAL